MTDIRLKNIQDQIFDTSHDSHREVISFYISLIRLNIKRYGVFNSSEDKTKCLYFIDGGIGSGKSTILKKYIKKNDIESLLYYNPEHYVYSFMDEVDFLCKYNHAKNFLWNDMTKRLLTGESFIVESVFTKEAKINFLNDAKEQGYKLYCIYVFTSNPKINIERVNLRVKEGSHTIPKEKIIDRYNKSIKNIKKILNLSDTFMLVDNSSYIPSLVFFKEGNTLCFSDSFQYEGIIV